LKMLGVSHYPIAAGTPGSIVLTDDADGIVIADAVKARYIPDYEVVVDDLDARYSDTDGFSLSSTSPSRYDATYRACLTGVSQSATWNLQLPFSGTWEIFEWHNGDTTSSSQAPYTIEYDEGTTMVPVNQQQNNGQWNSIGTYEFTEQLGSVVLSADCSGTYVIADAIRAVYIPTGNPTGISEQEWIHLK